MGAWLRACCWRQGSWGSGVRPEVAGAVTAHPGGIYVIHRTPEFLEMTREAERLRAC